MSIMEDVKTVTLKNPNMTAQMEGYGRNIEPLLITLNVSKVINKTISDRFLIRIDVICLNDTYAITGIHSMSEIDEQGNITLGTEYVMGPVRKEDISYRAEIRYLTS